MMNKNQKNNSVIIYEGENGNPKLEVQIENETVWLSQKQMAELFNCSSDNISLHIKNIFKDGELEENSVTEDFSVTASDKKNYTVKHYNLDVIISVGYRVKSLQATQFRIWASGILKEYIVKGFTMDDDRLKETGGGNYWKELLDRIRDIRSSEKVLYRQVLDLYATSIDYNANSPESIKFFKGVQNKLHYSTNKHAAAETVYSRVDAEKNFMGLETFNGSLPIKSEVSIAKNYLNKDELFVLNRLVSAFFDLAEIKAQEEKKMRMQDWVAELDTFAGIYGKGVLKNAGTVSHKQATEKATKEYLKYQAKTLSSVENAYLDTLKNIQKKVSKK